MWTPTLIEILMRLVSNQHFINQVMSHIILSTRHLALLLSFCFLMAAAFSDDGSHFWFILDHQLASSSINFTHKKLKIDWPSLQDKRCGQTKK